MKIAIVLPPRFTFDPVLPNSIETVVRTLLRHSKYHAQIKVFADEGATHPGGLDVQTVPAEKNRKHRTAHVITALRQWQPDLLELHQHAPTASRIAQAFPDVPSIFYRHNYINPPHNPLQRWRHRRRNRDFHAHVFVSQAAQDAFTGVFQDFSPTSHVVRNGIEVEDWLASVDPESRLIAYAGRAAPEKGFGEFCAAIQAILPNHPDWKAEIYGAAWETHAAWAEAQTAPLEGFGDRVIIKRDQPLDAVKDLLARAAIAAIPSHIQEAFGLSAVEAHAAGAAVISSGSGGLPEASGEHAIYIDPVTATTLANAMETLMNNPDMRLRLAREGQTYAIENHTAEARSADLDALRDRLLSGA